MKTLTDCPKCGGSGKIQAFSHIQAGDCFMCGATGQVEVDLEKMKTELTEYQRTGAEWIMASTSDSYSRLSYSKLFKIRDFAHSGGALAQAFPEMLAHWREHGEPHFQAAQEKKLAAMGPTWG